MKFHFFLAMTLLGLAAAPLSRAELLVYEGFDYTPGDNVLTPLDGGVGFSGTWIRAQEGANDSITVATGAPGTGNLDGVFNNTAVTTSPTGSGNRYIDGASGDDRITASRQLSQSAGALAGADKVLWASVIWTMNGSNYGRQVGFTLGTDGLSGRSTTISTNTAWGGTGAGDAMGVGGAFNSQSVTPTVWDGGGQVVRTTAGAKSLFTNQDNIVILKFVFADGTDPDTVHAWAFGETEAIDEATFNANAISASAVVDQDTLNILSFGQSQVSIETIDEIRLGDIFEDVTSGVIGSAIDNFQLIITPNSPNYDFTWNSLNGKLYDLVSSPDLATPISTWPVWDGRTNIAAAPPTNTLTDVPGVGDKRFFAIVEKDAPPPSTAPELSRLWGSGTTITLIFTEELEETAATNPQNYTVSNLDVLWWIDSAVLSPDARTVTLTLGAALPIGTTYSVTMSNLTGSDGTPLGGDTTVQFQTWDNDPIGIKVFILAGQSNMVGYGKSEWGGNPAWTPLNGEPKEILGGFGCLRHLANNNASFPQYDYTSLLVDPAQPATSGWKTRSDVKVWWHNGHSGNLGDPISKGDLGPPFQGANSNWLGPEYAFGQVLGDYYASNDVLIIKTAWGGHRLGVEFRPPSAVADRGGVVGASYLEIIANVREVLSNLGTEFPEWSGKGYQIVGIGWHQGFSDKVDGTLSAEYKDNLPDIISDLRAEFGSPDLPFAIATTGMNDAGPVEAPPYPGYSAVEKAQLWVADVPKPAKVLSSDTRGFWRAATVSPSTLGFHWNHNAESYFLIGKALGDDMVNLLAP